jgi:short subunit dehydrogenase-like uncharacterized protein
MSSRRIAVFGATGHTGRFVVEELQRRGFAPVAVARDAAKLAAFGGVETRRATIEDPDSLDRAFAGAAAVINCAGPFLDTADAVAGAALRLGMHYLDVAAEQASAQAMFETFDRAARAAGLLFLPAMGFYGGLADLLATAAMGDWNSADEIRIGIALDSWHPTRGTRLTGQRNTVPRVIVKAGQMAPLPDSGAATSWNFSLPFGRQEMVELPFSEIILIARHLDMAELHTYLNRAPLRDLLDPTTSLPAAAGRSGQIFQVEVRVLKNGRMRRAVARGRDIYASTAPLVVEAVQRILDGNARGLGVQAPGASFDAPSFLHALASGEIRVAIDGE